MKYMKIETPKEECWRRHHHRAGANCKEFPCWMPDKRAAGRETLERAEKAGLVNIHKERECVSQS